MKNVKTFFKGFNKGIKDFGANINIIVNTFLLSIVYFLGIGITSMIAKLIGKKFLQTKISSKKISYWKSLNLKKNPLSNHFRQF